MRVAWGPINFCLYLLPSDVLIEFFVLDDQSLNFHSYPDLQIDYVIHASQVHKHINIIRIAKSFHLIFFSFFK